MTNQKSKMKKKLATESTEWQSRSQIRSTNEKPEYREKRWGNGSTSLTIKDPTLPDSEVYK
jgi:hypothetical protein